MTFLRYPHLEKYGNSAVDNIELGITHVFPKLDGTNASVWVKDWVLYEQDGHPILATGSRNRTLSKESDNAGFNAYVQSQLEVWGPLYKFFAEKSYKYILYGEWLVPHTVKHYRKEAWNRFWIFDVYDREQGKFVPYDVYQPWLEEYGLDYIPCVQKFKNGSFENFLHVAKTNRFLLEDNDQPGEGCVIKNYDWTNKFQQVTWAKIVNQEFKDDFVATMGANLTENKSNAQKICDKACTEALIRKEFAKLNHDGKFTSHLIPRLLHTVFYSVVTEELWDCLKPINYGLVNFKELQQLCILKVKQTLPELF